MKGAAKEPSRKFIKYFVILFIINVSLAMIAYTASPKHIPTELTNQGFGDIQTRLLFFSLPFFN
jgi:hypothetical protein